MSTFFASTLLLSSGLLFLVQPLCAKMLLPTFGGSPAVWNTCMVFFQAGLLAGYAFVHFGNAFFGVKTHVVLQLLLFCLAVGALPIVIPRDVAPPATPVLWLIGTLASAAGVSFFAVATCGPLLQRGYALASGGKDPYSLYAASNLGSFLALFAYPALVEPNLTLGEQADLWRWGYVLLVAACSVAALLVTTKGERQPAAVSPFARPKPQDHLRSRAGQRAHWLVLALVPSSLMLSVTNYLTTDIAAIPLLWVIPLGIYLLTFTLVFAPPKCLPHSFMVRWMPLIVVVLAVILLLEATEPVLVVMGLHLVGLFWLAMVCHGELAETRPPAERLTEFYLWVAVGGVLGGIFNALVAPVLFPGVVEYPLMIALACFLRPSLKPATKARLRFEGPLLVGVLTVGLVLGGRILNLEPGASSVAFMFVVPLVFAYLLQNEPRLFAAGIALIFAASALYPGVHGETRYRTRSFFGVHRVTEQDGFRKLFHGNILHGEQNLDRRHRDEPLTYYHRTGPVGQLMVALKTDKRLQRVGLIGLGIGALASYAQPGQQWTFFEVDPGVAHIASPGAGLFTYLRDSPGAIDVVLGDGRLTLARHPDKFGLLVVDAFGSDAIPLHLLTREALDVYLAHLQENGILAVHISNRYVDLEPVLANLAAAAQPPLECRIQKDLSLNAAETSAGKKPSEWIVLARHGPDLESLAPWARWPRAQPRPDLGIWTDDFSNLVSVLR